MSSVQRYYKEPKCLKRQFAVYNYLGFGEENYFFTVVGNELFRIENDLRGVKWVVARDMGTQATINTINPEIIELWENNNGWSNISVIRPGIARKFQVVSMVRGNTSPSDPDGPAWNSSAYLSDYNDPTPIYDIETNLINEPLIVGNDTTPVLTNYYENLPYGTFWALNDPVVIEYTFSDVVYRRAIKNRIDETTLF